LYKLKNPEKVLTKLDEYEGFNPAGFSEYIRERVTVERSDGSQVEAWIFLYNLSTEGLVRIESGDFIQSKT
jgi:gamma-glutamylcyclotransferase (GGCT)/AIG2-like uncharacterized protein YtfP